jgi:cell division activator
MDGFRDVWLLRGKYVAFVLMGEHFRRSPAFSVPESAQRWAIKRDRKAKSPPEYGLKIKNRRAVGSAVFLCLPA